MKITNISTYTMGVGGVTATMPSRNWIFVRIDTDEGLYGIGEATTEWQEAAVVALIQEYFAPLLIGQDPTRIQFVWRQLQRGGHWRLGIAETSAISGIDQALWDLTGKLYGQPVYRLLGGAVRDYVRLYARSDLGLPGHVEEARAAAAEGFDAFKIGPGEIDLPFDEDAQIELAAQLTAVIQETRQDGWSLIVDCAGLFSQRGAHKLIQRLSVYEPFFLEEPLEPADVAAHAALRQSFPGVLIAGGERVVTRAGFRPWLEARALDVVQADVCHCGGITELMQIASCADMFGVRMAPHNPYGPVAFAANLHACIAMPNFLILEYCRLRPWFDQVQKHPIKTEGGRALPAQLPGLGVELDWDYVRKCPARPMTRRIYFDKEGAVANR